MAKKAKGVITKNSGTWFPFGGWEGKGFKSKEVRGGWLLEGGLFEFLISVVVFFFPFFFFFNI